jgi:osmoprotectant transport system ATP-binding protein
VAAAIEFRDVSYDLPDGRRLLDRVSLSVEAGTTTAILGRSGSGKTTLLRLVNRLLEPAGGAVWVGGRDVGETPLIALRRGIGYAIQETGLFPHFSVERNVGLVLEAAGKSPSDRRQRSRELLTMVGMDPDEFARRFPNQLSGGQRQRVGLARALAAEPAILLMDEPFGALDPLTRVEMQTMLRSLLRQLNGTLRTTSAVLVTHDLEEALYLGHRIVFLNEGRLLANLKPAEFVASPLPEIASYVKAFRRTDAGPGKAGQS